MFNLKRLIPMGALMLLTLGCATPLAMPYKDATQAAVKPTSSVYLMTVTLENAYKTGYQPDLVVVHVEKKDATTAEDRLNFRMDEIGTRKSAVAEKGNTYLIRMELEPGEYVVRGMTGFYNSLFVHASCFAPLHADLKPTGSGVFYLGHIDATIRERKDEEFKAGPALPLIDQGVAGFSGGTFDITITDAFDKDAQAFKDAFAPLKEANIQKSVLGAFDRAKAQAWWAAH